MTRRCYILISSCTAPQSLLSATVGVRGSKFDLWTLRVTLQWTCLIVQFWDSPVETSVRYSRRRSMGYTRVCVRSQWSRLRIFQIPNGRHSNVYPISCILLFNHFLLSHSTPRPLVWQLYCKINNRWKTHMLDQISHVLRPRRLIFAHINHPSNKISQVLVQTK